MKKEELLGMEVYYEDNPQPEPLVSRDAWAFGDSDEEDDFDEKYEDLDMDFLESDDHWGSHTLQPLTSKPIEHDDEEEDFTVIPVKGRIYKVRGLNIVARLREIRPLTPTAGIFEMDRYGSKFYINPSDLRRASKEEVESYLED